MRAQRIETIQLPESTLPEDHMVRGSNEDRMASMQQALDANFDNLVEYYRKNIRYGGSKDNEKHMVMLEDLKDDRMVSVGDSGNPMFRLLGLKNAPAAVSIHHARYGGLVAHIMEMINLAADLIQHMSDYTLSSFNKDITEAQPQLDARYVGRNESFFWEFIIKHILYHDIHKAYLYYGVRESTFKKGVFDVERINHSTDMLMGKDVKSMWMIMGKYGIYMHPKQLNLLCNAEGGYSDIKTPWQTSLAVFCATLDSLSSNVIDRGVTNTEYAINTKSDRRPDHMFAKNRIFTMGDLYLGGAKVDIGPVDPTLGPKPEYEPAEDDGPRFTLADYQTAYGWLNLYFPASKPIPYRGALMDKKLGCQNAVMDYYADHIGTENCSDYHARLEKWLVNNMIAEEVAQNE